MIIKSVELENIRSYKKANIQFNEGINFLSGDIGSGKSSILLAIEFGFFGFKKGEIEGFQLLRKGQNTASIKITLKDSKNNKEIEISRTIKKSKTNDSISQTNCSIKIDNNLIELSTQELNNYIFKLLNFPKEFLTKDKNLIYRFTIYTPQEQLKEILYTLPDKRLEIIRKIFDVDKYKILLNSISTYQSKIRADKKVYSSKLENVSKIKKDIKDLKEELKNLNDKLEDMQKKEKTQNDTLKKYKEASKKKEKEINDLSTKLVDLEKQNTNLENTQKHLEKLQKDFEEKSTKYENLQKEDIQKNIKDANEKIEKLQKDLDQLQKQKKEYEEQSKNYQKLLDKKEELNKKIYNQETLKEKIKYQKDEFDYTLTKCKLKDLENFIAQDKRILKKYDELKFNSKKLEREIIELNSNLKSFEKQKEEINDKINNLSNIKKCESCYQEVSQTHKETIKKSLKEEIKQADKNILENKNQIKSKTLILDKEQKQIDNLEKIKEELIEKEEKLKNLKLQENKEKEKSEEIKKLEKEYLKLKEQNLHKELKELNDKITQFKESSNKLKELNNQELNINKDISTLRLKISQYENIQKDKQLLHKDINNLQKEIEEKNNQLKSKNNITKQLDETKNTLKDLKQKKLKIDETIDKIYNNLSKITSMKSYIQSNIQTNKKQNKNKEEELEELNKTQKQYDKLIYIENFLIKKVSPISSDIEKSLLTKYYLDFNEEFEKLFKELIEDNDMEVRLDLGFSPIIEQNGYDIDIKNLSGGEKSSVAIAYRLGLKKIIENELIGKQKLSLLILDEPTDGFSNQQVIRLGNILKDSNLKQIILVSHDEKIEGISDEVLKVDKRNHISELTIS
jgi:exonuclease SbcC